MAICEGDSVDDTWDALQLWGEKDERVALVQTHTGAPHYPSIVDAGRFAVLATVFNAALGLVDLTWSDYVLFVPFDMQWQPDLAQRLAAHRVDMVSPLTWRDGLFYDTWAMTTLDGQTWDNFDRAWAEAHLGHGLIEMATIGGTVLIDAAVLRAGCRYTPDEVDRGLSHCARRHGFRLWVDPATEVMHPWQ